MKKCISILLVICLALASGIYCVNAEGAEIPKIRKPRAFGPVGFSFLEQYNATSQILIGGQYADFYLINATEGTLMQSLYDGVEFYYFSKVYTDWAIDDPDYLGTTDNKFKSASSRYYVLSNFGITPYPTKRLETGWEKGLTWEFNKADGEISYAKDWYIGALYEGKWTLFYIKITNNSNQWKEGGAGIILPRLYKEEVEVPVIPGRANILIDGKKAEMEFYNIEGYNYFKLRDVAMALKGTASEFGVEYFPDRFYTIVADNESKTYTGYGIVYVYGNTDYEPVGGELAISQVPETKGRVTNTPVLFNGNGAGIIPVYNIGGNNYCRIRDIAKGVDFALSWDEENQTIVIDSTQFFNASK